MMTTVNEVNNDETELLDKFIDYCTCAAVTILSSSEFSQSNGTIKYTSRPVRHLNTYQRWFSNNHRWQSKISASLSALGSILQNWGEFFSILQHLLLTAFIFCFQPIRWICRRVFICKYTTLPDTSIILEVGRNCAPMWDNGISSEVILNSDVS